jgi:Putative S-adenosyl-L-methionine-dependent methyltransferase
LCRRERLVDIAGEADERHLRFVLAPNITPASSPPQPQVALRTNLAHKRDCSYEPLHASVSSAGQHLSSAMATPLLLHDSLLTCPAGTAAAGPGAESVEVSPQSAAAAADLAKRVAASGGAALIIDYGNDAPAADSLRCAHVDDL